MQDVVVVDGKRLVDVPRPDNAGRAGCLAWIGLALVVALVLWLPGKLLGEPGPVDNRAGGEPVSFASLTPSPAASPSPVVLREFPSSVLLPSVAAIADTIDKSESDAAGDTEVVVSERWERDGWDWVATRVEWRVYEDGSARSSVRTLPKRAHGALNAGGVSFGGVAERIKRFKAREFAELLPVAKVPSSAKGLFDAWSAGGGLSVAQVLANVCDLHRYRALSLVERAVLLDTVANLPEITTAPGVDAKERAAISLRHEVDDELTVVLVDQGSGSVLECQQWAMTAPPDVVSPLVYPAVMSWTVFGSQRRV